MRLQPVVEVQHDLVERQLVGDQHAVRARYSIAFWTPRFSWHSCRMAPTCSDGVSIIAVITGSSMRLDPAGIGQLRRAVDLLHHAVGRGHAVEHARRGRDQVHVELALEPLLDDLHVQQPEEAAAEAEAQRRRRLRLEEERRVVQPQLLERVAQLRVLAALDRIEPGEDHRLADLEAGERLRRRAAPLR